MKDHYESLRTELQRGNPKELEAKRIKRIREALSLKKGTKESPKKHLITKLPDGQEVYFLKPGKEVFRKKNPNLNDMTPSVGKGEETYRFLDVWKQLSKVSVHDFDAFKAVLTLIYRDAYMLDHVEVSKGIIRYQPNADVMACIKDIDKTIDVHLEYGLFGFLNFMDLLGWNEDVKYQVASRKPKLGLDGDWKIGRMNTLLTCINVPYKAYLSVKNIVDKSSNLDEVDWDMFYDTLQTMTRGVSTPKQSDLIEWLRPHLIEPSDRA